VHVGDVMDRCVLPLLGQREVGRRLALRRLDVRLGFVHRHFLDDLLLLRLRLLAILQHLQ